MNDQFDELTKGLAQSVTRRAALKQFGRGVAGLALATFGLANNSHAARGGGCNCAKSDFGCRKKFDSAGPSYQQLVAACMADCQGYCDCKKNLWGC